MEKRKIFIMSVIAIIILATLAYFIFNFIVNDSISPRTDSHLFDSLPSAPQPYENALHAQPQNLPQEDTRAQIQYIQPLNQETAVEIASPTAP